MTQRIPVCLVVGDNLASESFSPRYFATSEEILTVCREQLRVCTRLYTTCPNIVMAFQCLHRLGEVELFVQRIVQGQVRDYTCDVRGDFIQPWPDEFFSLDFYLRFSAFQKETVNAAQENSSTSG